MRSSNGTAVEDFCVFVVSLFFFMIKPVTVFGTAQKFDFSKSQLRRGGISRAIPVYNSTPLV